MRRYQLRFRFRRIMCAIHTLHDYLLLIAYCGPYRACSFRSTRWLACSSRCDGYLVVNDQCTTYMVNMGPVRSIVNIFRSTRWLACSSRCDGYLVVNDQCTTYMVNMGPVRSIVNRENRNFLAAVMNGCSKNFYYFFTFFNMQRLLPFRSGGKLR
jgi:hypothetical protein